MADTEWKFDMFRLSAMAREIANARKMSVVDVALAINRPFEWTATFLSGYSTQQGMSISTFMALCNVFDLDPRLFLHQNVYTKTEQKNAG